MRAPLSSLTQLAQSIALAAAYVTLMAGMVISAGCQSGPDDDMEDSEADVEIDAVGEADAEDVDQDPNIGEPMN
jgi:2-keto-4-pentenoate hydratase